jgi:hypothetical protein
LTFFECPALERAHPLLEGHLTEQVTTTAGGPLSSDAETKSVVADARREGGESEAGTWRVVSHVPDCIVLELVEEGEDER